MNPLDTDSSGRLCGVLTSPCVVRISAKAVDGDDPARKPVSGCLHTARMGSVSLKSGVFWVGDDLKPVGAGLFIVTMDLNNDGIQQD